MPLSQPIKTVLGLTAVAALLPSLSAAPENLALHRDYVSSAPNVHGWDKPGLTDGVWGVDEATCYATDESPDFPKNVTVDLGASHSFTTVVVGVPPFGSTKTVEVSDSVDDVTFTPFGSHVFQTGEAQRAVLTSPQVNARYVRLTYPDHYAERHGGYPSTHALTSELEVYDGPAPAAPDPTLAATTATAKDRNRHQDFLDRLAVDPNIGLLFLGDSITDFWPRRGESSWLKFAPYQPADFGVSGDRTEHLLWRMTHGELDGIHPKVAVIMIGTNNAGRDAPGTTAAGIKKVVETVREKLPQTKILLLGVFPRDDHDAANRQKNVAVNEIISKLADGKAVHYLDIGKAFLDANGDLPKEVMPDKLHPNAKGYEIWYEAMWPTLQEMLR